MGKLGFVEAVRIMRKWLALLIVLLLTVLPLAATETKTVTADVTTSVSGYLLHGFLEKTDKTLRDTALVTDALGKDGSDLYYTIRTNQTASMVVYGVITPFQQEENDGSAGTNIAIDTVTVDGKVVSPLTGLQYISSQQPALNMDLNVSQTKTASDENKYELIEFSSVFGQTEYDYVIHITANQRQVAEAPAGRYVSSVTLSLIYKD